MAEKRRIFLTGDCLGHFDKIKKFYQENPETEGSLFILLGDTGINYFGGDRDDERRKPLAKLPYTFLIIRGNHDMDPAETGVCKEAMWEENPAMVHPEYPNQIFLNNGIVHIGDLRCLVIGGAYSVDKDIRLARGWQWFEDEQISWEEKFKMINISREEYFHLVLTHTCAFYDRPINAFLPGLDQSKVDNSMEWFLQDVKNNLGHFDKWYFGHYHTDRELSNTRCVMDDIIEHT